MCYRHLSYNFFKLLNSFQMSWFSLGTPITLCIDLLFIALDDCQLRDSMLKVVISDNKFHEICRRG
jgi:hypothetical protein